MGVQADKAKVVFKDELAMIRNPEITMFVLSVFDAFGHDRFYERPCSLTGRYHPQIAQGEGGLIRHVKYGVYWGDELARALLSPTGFDKDPVPYRDVVIAALILHDLLKDGDPHLDRERGINRLPNGEMDKNNSPGAMLRLVGGCHGVDLANAIFTRLLKGQATTDQILICYGIAGHMGVWTLPVEYRPYNVKGELAQKIAQIVHLADYCASRQADKFLLNIVKAVPGTPTA